MEVDVRNLGDRSGDDVIMVHVRDLVASIAPPVRRLRGFQRITLEPGESRTIGFTLGFDDLGFWTNDPAGTYTVEPGEFRLILTDGSTSYESTFEVIAPAWSSGGPVV